MNVLNKHRATVTLFLCPIFQSKTLAWQLGIQMKTAIVFPLETVNNKIRVGPLDINTQDELFS